MKAWFGVPVKGKIQCDELIFYRLEDGRVIVESGGYVQAELDQMDATALGDWLKEADDYCSRR